MRKFLLGFVVGLVIIPLGVLAYLKAGMAPVATSAPPLPFEKRMTRMALNARVEKEAPKDPPFAADENNLQAGAVVYQMNCAVCHGVPNRPRTPLEKGMFPKPPELLHGKGVTDDPPGESYWKIANGIRLTGMPGFKPSLTETEMWQVALLVANADKLPPSVQSALASPAH
jgi:thiosulfate dehydrogenase